MISQERLKELLTYYPKSGNFRWNVDRPRVKKGNIAGCKRNGYIVIRISGINYYAHRLVFLYMTGNWPNDTIDHRNGIGTDNKWHNLRDVTHRENSDNRCFLNTNNNSGYNGVGLVPGNDRHKPWRARIGSKTIGYYLTAEKAHEALEVAYL